MAFYIDELNPKIEAVGETKLNVTLSDGTVFENVEPRRLFPSNNRENYISFVDKSGTERAILESLESLNDSSKEAVQNSLEEYYRLPKISEVLDVSNKKGILKYTCMTDKGECSFVVTQRRDTKILPDGRIIFRDSSDNRYEIPDYSKLNHKSKRLLENEI